MARPAPTSAQPQQPQGAGARHIMQYAVCSAGTGAGAREREQSLTENGGGPAGPERAGAGAGSRQCAKLRARECVGFRVARCWALGFALGT
jgi:hypothetical protein